MAEAMTELQRTEGAWRGSGLLSWPHWLVTLPWLLCEGNFWSPPVGVGSSCWTGPELWRCRSRRIQGFQTAVEGTVMAGLVLCIWVPREPASPSSLS